MLGSHSKPRGSAPWTPATAWCLFLPPAVCFFHCVVPFSSTCGEPFPLRGAFLLEIRRIARAGAGLSIRRFSFCRETFSEVSRQNPIRRIARAGAELSIRRVSFCRETFSEVSRQNPIRRIARAGADLSIHRIGFCRETFSEVSRQNPIRRIDRAGADLSICRVGFCRETFSEVSFFRRSNRGAGSPETKWSFSTTFTFLNEGGIVVKN